MKQVRTTLLAGLVAIGLLIVPGAGAAAVQPTVPTIVTGWTCHPNGSGAIGSPSTTLSSAVLFEGTPHLDSIQCLFLNLRGAPVAPSLGTVFGFGFGFGGDCYFNEGKGTGIEFSHRLYQVRGTIAILLCWDGSSAPG